MRSVLLFVVCLAWPGVHNALPVNNRIVCVVMREPEVRALDTVHPGCAFFDIYGSTAHWRGEAVSLPCSGYNSACYTKKLAVLIEKLLETSLDYFYYLENDTSMCITLKMLKRFTAYLAPHTSNELLTTGIGASGWLFTRKWAEMFLHDLRTCGKWCHCPDCVAALVRLPRATTRLVVVQHIAQAQAKVGLNSNDKHLPRCMEKRRFSGMNKFDFFDHEECALHDITPCGQQNRDFFSQWPMF